MSTFWAAVALIVFAVMALAIVAYLLVTAPGTVNVTFTPA